MRGFREDPLQQLAGRLFEIFRAVVPPLLLDALVVRLLSEHLKCFIDLFSVNPKLKSSIHAIKTASVTLQLIVELK